MSEEFTKTEAAIYHLYETASAQSRQFLRSLQTIRAIARSARSQPNAPGARFRDAVTEIEKEAAVAIDNAQDKPRS